MIIYFFILLLTMIGHYVDPDGNNIKMWYTINFIIAFFICCGYTTGSDWRGYEYQYYDYKPFDFYTEPGFVILQSIFQLLKIDFWHFALFVKFVLYTIIIKAIKEYVGFNCYFSLAYFYVLIGLFGFIDFPMRNMISVCIALYCFKYYCSGQKMKYFFFAGLSACFHYSGILMFLIYFIRLEKIRSRNLILLFVIFNIAISFIDIYVFDYINSMLDGSFAQYYIDAYFSDEENTLGKGISIGYLMHIVFFLSIIKYRKEIQKLRYGKALLLCGVLYPFLYRIGLTFWIFGRFELFVGILYCCTVGYILKFVPYKRSIIKISYIYFALLIYVNVTSSYKFVPYTNYFFEIGNDWTYYQRDNYNLKQSPYKK